MAKLKISDYSSTSAGANLNTDINSIDIDEGCAPSGINNAIRTLMAQLKDFQTGVSGDSLTLGGALSGTSATFSGNVTASAISGASLTLSGNITASAISGASLTLSGALSGTSATFSGNVTASAISGASLTLSGNITASAISGVSMTLSDDIIFTGTGNRITGDFTNATHENRVAFQSSTTNGATTPFIIPNGTNTNAGIVVANASNPTNSSYGQLAVIGTTDVRVVSGVIGTGTSLPMSFYTNGSERMRIDTSGNVGIGTTAPSSDGPLSIQRDGAGACELNISLINGVSNKECIVNFGNNLATANRYKGRIFYQTDNNVMGFWTNTTERMRIDSSGNLLVGKTSASGATAGVQLEPSGLTTLVRSGGVVLQINRLTNDGNLIDFYQDTVLEGNISVSGSTVSYNGGHLSRWSQWQNETGQPNVYRGTVLESTNDMCEWEKDGEPLPNEQATKTIVSTTVASKAVAGVFDRYDEDDKDNPYDFYVAQSGDFVIRIAQGVTVQNGDLLESAGDGTAKPQADDICRSSTVAKVTSNYVSATYEDGSYCVPCILMIG